jgi:hypothetical protein
MIEGRSPIARVLRSAGQRRSTSFTDGPVWADAGAADAARIPDHHIPARQATAWLREPETAPEPNQNDA